MIDVKEFIPMECIEVTGNFRIVNLELAEYEEIELPSTLEENDDEEAE